MIQQDGIKNYFKGFAVASLLLATVLWVSSLGAQQGASDPNESVVEGESMIITDDPLGRNNIPVDPNAEDKGSNLDSAEVDLELWNPAGPDQVEGQLGPEANPSGYSSPLVIPAADFRHDGNAPENYFFPFGSGRIYARNTTSCLMAPAYLPNGADVYQLWASVVDEEATDITVYLRRVDNFNGTVDTMGVASSSGTSPNIDSISDLSIDFSVVDYPTYSYYVTSCLPLDSDIYSVRLWYTN